eukprot:gnl/TRDRNA2_/TRDRNA2_201855_c0_seq1.p1 gnl/TRDRNA2_/TRDRNA2_201855_c0~~gnl/TRDRNA2_/TRDRNA2_201855_c0_seq1.p1  ORF type:complete len:278 (+),score=35.05 gnl/TRDRNA2_/TRDRNA2_201855_c0_seq1:60-893(+)
MRRRILQSTIATVVFALLTHARPLLRAGHSPSSPWVRPFFVQAAPLRRSTGAERAIAKASKDGDTSSTARTTNLFPQQMNVLYDSKCSICDYEIKFLQSKDKDGQLLFTDIEDPNYDENDPKNGRVSYEEAMKVIHAVRPDGSLVKGYDVFGAMYTAVGLPWVYPSTDSPVIGSIIDKVSNVWFKYRTVLTRGKTLDSIFNDRKQCETCPPMGGRAAAEEAEAPTKVLYAKTSGFTARPAAALIGLSLGTGIALAALHVARGISIAGKEPLLVQPLD